MDDYRIPPLPRGVDSATITPIKHVNGGVAVSAPAGWYDDGTGQQRWWDGGAWGVYAQDVSSVPGDPGAAGYGQVAGSVGQPAKSSGVFNALGQAVKNAAVEQKSLAIGALTAGVSVRSVGVKSVFGKPSALGWLEGG